ncbi:MAG: NapC/NirT family cytochrome c [Chloroflexi bacterium]|nr:NapC/NirT family cytochrome c [Chloroflexota bacterium]
MVKRILAAFGLAIAAYVLWSVLGAATPAVSHPPVPERPDGTYDCASCHGPGAAPRPAEPAPLVPADHVGPKYGADSCLTCHVSVVKASPLAASYATCAACHVDTDRTATLKSGEKLVVAVDIKRYLTSVHGDFACTTCHEPQETIPHEPLTAEGRREFTREMAELCTTCHKGATASYEESFHGMAARLGVIRAATCTDCHTPHAVQAAANWSLADRAASCATCHSGATESLASGWLGHEEPSAGWFPLVFYAEKFFVGLTAITLGLGIVHVELDLLRWAWDRARRRKEDRP